MPPAVFSTGTEWERAKDDRRTSPLANGCILQTGTPAHRTVGRLIDKLYLLNTLYESESIGRCKKGRQKGSTQVQESIVGYGRESPKGRRKGYLAYDNRRTLKNDYSSVTDWLKKAGGVKIFHWPRQQSQVIKGREMRAP